MLLAVLFLDGRDISGPRHVLVHRHQVDEAHGLLRLLHGAADEDLAVSSRPAISVNTCIFNDRTTEINDLFLSEMESIVEGRIRS